MYFFYSLLTAAGMSLLSPYFLIQGLRRGKYLHNLRERFGHLPADFPRGPAAAPCAIWLHAVSVGEVLAALPLAQALKQQFPSRPLFISTTTVTGQRLARERMPFADATFYFPLDWRGPIRRVFNVVQPALIVIMETEIWPNLLRAARAADVPVVFINGRISKRSYRGYRLANRLSGGFLARVLRDAELFLMQSDEDAKRLLDLGAPQGRVAVAGNLKYDLAAPASGPIVEWLEGQGRQPVVVAGSVVAGEEEPVLAAFSTVREKWPRALLVLAPRKPERFDSAARLATERGCKVVRRSQVSLDAPLQESADVILLDSIGELGSLYRLADTVFVGGSLAHGGGHNILEPALFGKPPIFGPSMHNFREMAEHFLASGAGLQVASAAELAAAWVELLGNASRREQMGRAAQELVARHRGATQRALQRIAAILAAHRSQS